MQIFQKSVVKKHISSLDKIKVDSAFSKFKINYSPEKIEKIKLLKEEEYQDGFLRDIFVDIFGYTLKPNENYNLVRELKNQADSKKADGAILIGDKVVAVIELKSTITKDLTSITQQAFNYKNNQQGCKYVITSNFQKLRFYIDYANEYEEFDLFNLQKTDFELLYLILSKDSIFSDLPLTIKKETRFHEQKISEQLYQDYSDFKYKIFENIVKNNPKFDKLTLFEKSQKLLDRLLFIFFAEDCGLLPTNSISRIIERFDRLAEDDAYKPLYEIYKQYFGYMNIGRKGKVPADDIPAYNGGLFAHDDILDKIKIDDEVLKKDSLKLSSYDFSTEVDVNILGHIFEHSLNEIEEVEKQLATGSDIEVIKTSKRKKDGVFYTPKYITQYIVLNTLGKHCQDKRTELGIFEVEFDSSFRTKKGLNEKGKSLYEKLTSYKDWLKSLKIIDPACGSGAFLNQALNFLIAEHEQIDDFIADLTGTGIRIFDTDKTILENNLYGVDINQESVEIARLSLWLRTAKKDRKLSMLNDNIKCGNSLVDDYSLNYRKAFDWKKEFSEIMKNGGFDVVIGNPPYIKEYTNREAFTGLHSHYCYQGKMDLWYFFGCLALQIVKKDSGLIGYIAPNNWITNSGASKFRNQILKKGKILEFVDFGDFKVFDSAGIQTMIYIMQRTENNDNYTFQYSKIIDSKITHEINQKFLQKINDERFTYFTAKIERDNLIDKTINFNNSSNETILEKIQKKQNFKLDDKELANAIIPNPDYLNNSILKKIPEEKIKHFNLKSGDGVFVVPKNYFKSLNIKEKQYIKPLIEATEVERYVFPDKSNQEIIYFTKKNFDGNACPTLIKHLEKFKEVMLERRETKSGQMDFYHIHWPRNENFFKEGSKILSVRKCSKPTFIYTEKEAYVTGKFYVLKSDRIDLKYLTGLLNSKLIAFWLKYKGKMQGDNYQIDKEPLLDLPLIEPSKEKQNEIAELVTQIIENKQKEIDYKDLLKQAKAENSFDREIKLKKELENITKTIETAENKINNEIFKLYDLNENEITFVNEIY